MSLAAKRKGDLFSEIAELETDKVEGTASEGAAAVSEDVVVTADKSKAAKTAKQAKQATQATQAKQAARRRRLRRPREKGRRR